MPKVDAAPIELSAVQTAALIAFLQSKAGLEPSVAVPSSAEAGKEKAVEADEKSSEEEDGPAKTAVAALEKFGCAACHDLEGSKADAGPKLNGIASRMGREKIIEAILKPNTVIAKGFEADMMPQDFGEQMRVTELNLVVEYLSKMKN